MPFPYYMDHIQQSTNFCDHIEVIDSAFLCETEITKTAEMNEKQEINVQLLIRIVYGLISTVFSLIIFIQYINDTEDITYKVKLVYLFITCFIVVVLSIYMTYMQYMRFFNEVLWMICVIYQLIHISTASLLPLVN